MFVRGMLKTHKLKVSICTKQGVRGFWSVNLDWHFLSKVYLFIHLFFSLQANMPSRRIKIFYKRNTNKESLKFGLSWQLEHGR